VPGKFTLKVLEDFLWVSTRLCGVLTVEVGIEFENLRDGHHNWECLHIVRQYLQEDSELDLENEDLFSEYGFFSNLLSSVDDPVEAL
jgi:hypothetical protein